MVSASKTAQVERRSGPVEDPTPHVVGQNALQQRQRVRAADAQHPPARESHACRQHCFEASCMLSADI